MSKNRKKSSETKAHPSRRAFVKSAMLGAGATAALGTTGVGVGAQETNGEGITIPPEFAAAKKASLPAVDFPMIGDWLRQTKAGDRADRGIFGRGRHLVDQGGTPVGVGEHQIGKGPTDIDPD